MNLNGPTKRTYVLHFYFKRQPKLIAKLVFNTIGVEIKCNLNVISLVVDIFDGSRTKTKYGPKINVNFFCFLFKATLFYNSYACEVYCRARPFSCTTIFEVVRKFLCSLTVRKCLLMALLRVSLLITSGGT